MTASACPSIASQSIASLSIPGGWTTRRVSVGSRTFDLLVPANPDEFLNHLVEPLDTTQPHLADPYWTKLWPAAEHLAAAILQNGAGPPENNAAPRLCLELGCGSGLAGMAALAAGWDVTFSDYVPQAVELALENAARNGFPAARGRGLDWPAPPAAPIAHGNSPAVTEQPAQNGPPLDTQPAGLPPPGQGPRAQ
jgi:predicted nicotinamide N-methyase